MKLGFVSSMFGELSGEQVIKLAADEGFSCVALMMCRLLPMPQTILTQIEGGG